MYKILNFFPFVIYIFEKKSLKVLKNDFSDTPGLQICSLMKQYTTRKSRKLNINLKDLYQSSFFWNMMLVFLALFCPQISPYLYSQLIFNRYSTLLYKQFRNCIYYLCCLNRLWHGDYVGLSSGIVQRPVLSYQPSWSVLLLASCGKLSTGFHHLYTVLDLYLRKYVNFH